MNVLFFFFLVRMQHACSFNVVTFGDKCVDKACVIVSSVFRCTGVCLVSNSACLTNTRCSAHRLRRFCKNQ